MYLNILNGGERGIRTLEGFYTLHAFQASAIDHSAISPKNSSKDACLLDHEGFRVATHLTKSRRPNQMLPLLPSGPGGVHNISSRGNQVGYHNVEDPKR